MKTLLLAAAAWTPRWHSTWEAFAQSVELRLSAVRSADLVLLPEYAGVEAALIGAPQTHSPVEWCQRAAGCAIRYRDLCRGLARRYRSWLVSGSLPVAVQGGLRNRAFICGPNGELSWQDKQILTPWERANTPLEPGDCLNVFETALGRISVLVCYDSEFPRMAEAAAADVLLIPSCTDALSGQTRVRVAARARALEGQCFVAQAPLVGGVPHCPLIDENVGRAGIFAPPDHPFPPNGVLAETKPQAPGWATIQIDSGALATNRQHGAVLPRQDAEWARIRAAAITPQRLRTDRP